MFQSDMIKDIPCYVSDVSKGFSHANLLSHDFTQCLFINKFVDDSKTGLRVPKESFNISKKSQILTSL